MFIDDQPVYPMTFVVQFDFSGAIDRSAFQKAIDKGLQRHPMLRAMIRPAKSNRDCWVRAESYDSEVRWGALDEPILVAGTGEYLDLRNEIGFRCWCRHDDQRALVTFVFHHSACDGIGGYQFIGDVLWYYSASMENESSELVELTESDLRQRLKCNISPAMTRNRKESRLVGNETAQPLAARQKERLVQAGTRPFPNFHTHTYEKDQYKELRLKAQECGQTTNDRLLETLLVAMRSWNSAYAPETLNDTKFCINMPLDLRQAGQPAFSAVNLVTSAFVRRSASEICDQSTLVTSLREEAVHIKHSRFDSEFMRRLVESPIDLTDAQSNYDTNDCHATVVFSNTGDPTRRFTVELPREKGLVRCGNLLLEDINGVPPLRPQTRVAISVFTYRRRLRICIRCDADYFSDADGEAFLTHFCDCFEKGGASSL